MSNCSCTDSKCKAVNVVPRIGKPAPGFSCQGVFQKKFKKYSLEQFKGKWVVLVFYPLDFTFVCPTEIIAYSKWAEKFRAENTEILYVSTDSVFSHLAWLKTDPKTGGLGQDIKFPLLSDLSHEISKSYGVLIEDGDDAGATFRGLFIIDDKGVLRCAHIHDNSVGRNPEETLRIVQGYQFADEHGEVCPAGWKKGGKTIKPTPEASQEYFGSTSS